MNFFLIFTSALSFSLNSILMKVFMLKYMKSKSSVKLFLAISCLCASVLNLILFAGSPVSDYRTIILAVLFGVCFYFACDTGFRAIQTGPLSLSSIIMNMSLAIPLLYSCAILGEKVGLLNIAGVALLVFTFIMSGVSENKGDNKYSKQWLITLLIYFVTNGMTAVFQKEQQILTDGGDKFFFMCVAYFTAFAIFITGYLRGNKKRTENVEKSNSVQTYIIGAAAGVSNFIGNGLLIFLAVKVPGIILYPCVNGGIAVLTAIIAFVFFKEPMSKFKSAILLTGIISIVLLAIG